ncbi:MAG: DUF4386 domain-containing protein [Actinomycetia bacterium]|nr:DUF4386 domain-containing protein [Actinomycetes bacterium]MCP4084855.1 DUF4386 domain-containing protein [Actinomycetes bacterium]
MSAPIQDSTHPPASAAPGETSWEGRAFGAIVLAAFLLYGIGSASPDQPIGMILVALNSIAVAYAGLIGFRLMRPSDPRVGLGYLTARVAEAALLAGGVVLAQHADVGEADVTGYLLAMIALGAGSIPFCRSLGRRRWIPQPLATWGTYGYAALTIGALLELATGRSVSVILAVPGGLFELVLGVYLVLYGFRRPATQALPANRHQ